ncbi:MAG: hypothetical protein P8I38_14625 [Arenicella sp.]|jgi:hypothetical protein|nr:hypothetical protein [Arenicella sp.]
MSDSKKSPNSRRQFVKRSLLGAGSISVFTLLPSAHAQEGLPAITSFLLDEPDEVLTFNPVPGTNAPQTVPVPPNARSMTVRVVGGGGGGAGVRGQSLVNGGRGGDAGVFSRSRIDVSGITELTLQVGEGAKATEASEIGQPGEFGGGAAGSAFNSPASSTGASMSWP